MAGTRKNVRRRELGVRLWEVENVGFICVWEQKKCPLKRGVRLWEVKNVGFICGWDQKKNVHLRGESTYWRLKI